MNIQNLALVRATNVLPFDGIVKPLSNDYYLTKNIGLEFSSKLSDLLHELGIIPPLDPTKMFENNYYDNMVHESNTILKEYLPYVSDYNSFVLFSINGLCPDDSEHGFGNNTFSNKKCAIIEPFIHHFSEAVSIVPTDTAIKGNVTLSNEAILLIEEATYDSLTLEEKSRLKNVKTFKGSLKEAVANELENSNRYTSETLSLSASTKGILDSSTSEELKDLIERTRTTLGLSRLKYFNLITTSDTSGPKYDMAKDEYGNALKVQDYYMKQFLRAFLDFFYIEYKELDPHNKRQIEEIIEQIKKIGITQYKTFVDQYNESLLEQRKKETLKTPQEIIEGKVEKHL